MKNSKKCSELSTEIMEVMCQDGYSAQSVKRHVGYVYNTLTQFCDEHYDGIYSQEAGEAFISMILEKTTCKDYQALHKNSIERLNYALSGDIHWQPPKSKQKPYKSSCYDNILIGYESYLLQKGTEKNSVRSHIHLVSKFLASIESKGITDLNMIKADHIYESFQISKDKDGFYKKIKRFFRYAYNYELITFNISLWMPAFPRHKPIPTVYTKEELKNTLMSIDRNTDIGKRNYCIVLIATKLGIRSCDITKLSITDINFDNNTILIKQQKTNVMIKYPISNDILIALNDYLNNARPNSPLPNVFLTNPHPSTSAISTQCIYHIVTSSMKKAGIDISQRRHGAHALRSSLASNLLIEGKNYSEIQQVLGHTSPDVAKHYIRLEIEQLRQCALKTPPLTQKITAQLLKGQVSEL